MNSAWKESACIVAVSTCFAISACDGLCHLTKVMDQVAWDTIWVSTDHVNLCQAHCKQVPDFSRAQG